MTLAIAISLAAIAVSLVSFIYTNRLIKLNRKLRRQIMANEAKRTSRAQWRHTRWKQGKEVRDA